MARSDSHTQTNNLFGEDFDLLSAHLAHPDPVERAKALTFLEIYLDDCTRPIRQLQNQVRIAAHAARTQSAEDMQAAFGLPETIALLPATGSREVDDTKRRQQSKIRAKKQAKSAASVPEQKPSRLSQHEDAVASLEAFIGSADEA